MRGLLLAPGALLATLPPWARVGLLLAAMVALVRGRLKPGYALFLGAILLALSALKGSGQGLELEHFVNALNQGVTGVPTVRLILSLLGLAWLGEVLAEGAATRRLEEGMRALVPDLRAREILQSTAAGLLPPAAGKPAPPALPAKEAQGSALGIWFSHIGSLTFPLGAGLVVACELGHLPLGSAAALLAPLAIVMAALGLLTLAREIPPAAPEVAASALSRREALLQLLTALAPTMIALAGAFWIPQTEIPKVRSGFAAGRIAEGLLGLLSPLALGALLGGLLSGRSLGLSGGTLWRVLRRVSTAELAVFAVGIKVLELAAAVPLRPYAPATADAVCESLKNLDPSGRFSMAALAALALPALMGFLLGGAAEGLASVLPFLMPLLGQDFRLLSLAYAGAFLGALLSERGLSAPDGGGAQAGLGPLRWRLALPTALMALSAALMTSA